MAHCVGPRALTGRRGVATQGILFTSKVSAKSPRDIPCRNEAPFGARRPGVASAPQGSPGPVLCHLKTCGSWTAGTWVGVGHRAHIGGDLCARIAHLLPCRLGLHTRQRSQPRFVAVAEHARILKKVGRFRSCFASRAQESALAMGREDLSLGPWHRDSVTQVVQQTNFSRSASNK